MGPACLLLSCIPDDHKVPDVFVHDILSCVVSHSPPWPCLAAVVIVDVVAVVVVSGQHHIPSSAGRG